MIREYFHLPGDQQRFTVGLDGDPAVRYHGEADELDGCGVTLVDTAGDRNGRARDACFEVPERRPIHRQLRRRRDEPRHGPSWLQFHLAHGRLGTVTAVRPTSRFGVIDLEGDAVVRFREKPKLDDWISAGYFVLEREVLGRIGGDDCALELEPLAGLAADNELRAFRHEGLWQPMDTFREYELLNDLSPPTTPGCNRWSRTRRMSAEASPDTWRDTSVFITGGTGLAGGWLAGR